MRRIILVGLMALFAASSFTAVSVTVASTSVYAAGKKKDAPGRCGATNYYDKKKKKCVSAIR